MLLLDVGGLAELHCEKQEWGGKRSAKRRVMFLRKQKENLSLVAPPPSALLSLLYFSFPLFFGVFFMKCSDWEGAGGMRGEDGSLVWTHP